MYSSYEALASTFSGYGDADQPCAHAQADLCLRYLRMLKELRSHCDVQCSIRNVCCSHKYTD